MVNLNTQRNNYDWDLIDSWRYGESLSYKSIRDRHLEEFGFTPSKGTLSNRYGKGVAEKAKARKAKRAETSFFKLGKKLDRFKHKKPKKGLLVKEEYATTEWDRFRDKLTKFRRKGNAKMETWTTQDAVDKFWPNGESECGHQYPFIECYLTGEVVKACDTTTHCDHVDPDGGNGLDNLSFVTRDANQMKSYLHMDEWVKLAEVMIARHYARKELENK